MTVLPERSNHDLMLAVGRGDLAALDLLFLRHHRRLYGFLARLTGDRDMADDLVQEVFLRLLRFREGYRDDGAFLPWLFRIARNVAADRRRPEPTTAIDDDEYPSSDLPALDLMITAEHHQQLERALQALPESERAVLLLRGAEQLSHRDLAVALGCTEGAARVRVHRALAALKRQWHATAGELHD